VIKIQRYKGKVKGESWYQEGYALATKHKIYIGTVPYVSEDELCLDHWFEVDPETVEEVAGVRKHLEEEL